MNRTEIAAELLLAAHRTGRLIDDLPFALESRNEAYAVQAAVAEGLSPVVGWKAGLSSDGTFVRAPLYRHRFYLSPASVRRDEFNRLLVESELAVKFAQAFPPRPVPYGQEDVIAGIESLHAAIETVDTCFAQWPKVDPNWMLAAGLSHGCFILGGGRPAGDLSGILQGTYELGIDGVSVKSGTGNHPAGDPIAMLVWLVNDLARSGTGIRAGDVVTTGTFSGATAVDAGQTVRVEFAGVGNVILSVV